MEYILKVCERTAKAIQIEFGLNKKVMTDYRKFIKENSNSNSANTFYKSMTLQSAEQTKAVVYELCDNLDDPNEIMEHIRMSDELIFAWQPKRQDTD